MTKRVALAFAVIALASAPAMAQTQITSGVIQGVVTDSTGGVLPGVAVEARNADTNFTRTDVTSGEGRFALLQLPPGRYAVTFTLDGFATLVRDGVVVRVGQSVDLAPQMQVSGTQETITVSGTPLVERSRTEVSSVLDTTTIETTPVLGRKFEDLLTLTPGVSIVQGPDGDEINFFGQRGVFNNISLDGGDYNNGFFGEQVGGQRANIDITLDAIQEFQVVAAGAGPEFGRTAGGVVNVITKSGTNEIHGSLFHFQRLESLTSKLSDGSELKDFHREQTGGTIGGPLSKDKAFFFLAAEHINGNFERPNLSTSLGSCPVGSPNVFEHESLIGGNSECQRLALLDFFRATRNQEEGQPVEHPTETTSVFAKLNFLLNDANNLAISYNFLSSRNENDTFDVATYGNSANGIEGTAKINVLNLNLSSTLSDSAVNEFHVSLTREDRPRAAVDSNVPADTAMGFGPSFRFGAPFFLQPTVDERFERFQVKNNLSIVSGSHTFKIGAEWIHSKNDQVFRGFFTGRYIFDSVTGFLRYASPAQSGGYGPNTATCGDGSFVTFPDPCPDGGGPVGGPLLLYLQDVGTGRSGVPPPGASDITNDEIGIFVQDSWKIGQRFTLNYGLRFDAQLMPETVDPSTTVFAPFLGDPNFRSDGTIPDQKDMWQPRVGFAWDVTGDAKNVVRAAAGIYNPRQNMLTQVGSVTTNGLQQQTIFRDFSFVTFAPMPVWPDVLPAPDLPADGSFPLFSGVRVFASDYKNPRIYTWNVTYERELAPDWSGYVDFTWARGVFLTRFFNINRNGDFSPQLGDVYLTTSQGQSLYRGGTIGIKKRFSNGFQIEANYALSKDLDDDSNERDPFTDRSFDFTDPALDYALSDRDIKHKFNAFAYAEIGPVQLNVRLQARSAQPISPSPIELVDPGSRTPTNRNTLRKDNEFFSLDWRLQVPIRFGDSKQYTLMPVIEMFNTTNSDNNVNPLSTPALFNFDGFLRTGVGDPRQLQLALRFLF